MITYLTPNQYEAEQLFTLYKDDSDLLISLKAKLVITKGAQGVLLYDGEREVSIPAFKVEAVDTTGAGDTFNGALAVALSEGNDLRSACEFAVKSSALSVTKLGAQSGMPSREEVNRF
jgi:ribokinase